MQKREEADHALISMEKKIDDAADRVGREQELDGEARKKISESKITNEQATVFRNLTALEKEILEALRNCPEDDDKKIALENVREKMRAIF